MDNNEIIAAFDLLIGQLESFIDVLNKKGADYILTSNYLEAKRLLAKIDALTQFNRKITLLKNDWAIFQSDLDDNKEPIESSHDTEFFDISTESQTDYMRPSKKTPNVIVLRDRENTKVNGPQEYDLEFHLYGKNRGIVELYRLIDSKIATIASTIYRKYNKMFIAYSDSDKVCDIRVQNDKLKVWLKPPIEQLNDPLNLCRDVRSVGHYSSGNTEVEIKDRNDIEPVFDLIKQSYKISGNYY